MNKLFKRLYPCCLLMLVACNQQSPASGVGALEASGQPALDVVAVKASAHDGHVPESTLDGDLGTRWSAFGDGQWIRYDLGAAFTVGSVNIAFYVGDRRVSYFDIETSRDGASWTRVHSGASSGTTRALEAFDIPDTSARYVRIVGHKNSSNAWNSLTEVTIQAAQGGGGAAQAAFTSPLVAQHSDKCMDVYRGRLEPGTRLIQYSCSGNDNQQFGFYPEAGQSGAFTLRSAVSGLCAEVSADQTYEGHSMLVQNSCDGEANQIFTLQAGKANTNVFQLVAGHSGKCVDVADISRENRAQLIQYACHTGANQQWHIANFSGGAALPPPIPQGDNEVVPIRWASFTRGQPRDPAALDLRTATLNANKFLLSTWWHEVKDFDAQKGPYLDFGGRGAHQIRNAAAAAVSLAVSLKIGIYDATHTGVGANNARTKALRLIRSLAYRHKVNSEQGWGYGWQPSLWAHKVGLAAWLLWDDLSAAEQEHVRAMLEAEADRLIGYQVPYYRDPEGHILSSGDTKAEENAWNASLLHLAVAMMPEHPHRHAWTYKNYELKVSSYAQPSDLSNRTRLHGRPLKDWLYGSNAYNDGVVVNHKRVHPDYMAAIEHNLEGAIVSSLAGQPTPRAALVNADATYKALVDRYFAEGSSYPDTARVAAPPGGTMYVDGSGDLYYPQDNDWGTDRVIPYVLLDALAAAFEFDAAASRGAEVWAEVHTAKLLQMQGRHADGRTYALAPDTHGKCTRHGVDEFSQEDTFCGREEYVSEFVALAYLSRWLVHQGAYSLMNDAAAIVVDNSDREFSFRGGSWTLDEAPSSLGRDALHAAAGSGGAVVRYTPRLPEAGTYRVYAWWSCDARAPDAPYTVRHATGTSILRLDQRTDCGRWSPVGTFSFKRGTSGYVEQSDDASARVSADAVMFLR